MVIKYLFDFLVVEDGVELFEPELELLLRDEAVAVLVEDPESLLQLLLVVVLVLEKEPLVFCFHLPIYLLLIGFHAPHICPNNCFLMGGPHSTKDIILTLHPVDPGSILGVPKDFFLTEI